MPAASVAVIESGLGSVVIFLPRFPPDRGVSRRSAEQRAIALAPVARETQGKFEVTRLAIDRVDRLILP